MDLANPANPAKQTGPEDESDLRTPGSESTRSVKPTTQLTLIDFLTKGFDPLAAQHFLGFLYVINFDNQNGVITS